MASDSQELKERVGLTPAEAVELASLRRRCAEQRKALSAPNAESYKARGDKITELNNALQAAEKRSRREKRERQAWVDEQKRLVAKNLDLVREVQGLRSELAGYEMEALALRDRLRDEVVFLRLWPMRIRLRQYRRAHSLRTCLAEAYRNAPEVKPL